MATMDNQMEIVISPSKKLLALIEQHGSVLAASEAWGIPNATLARFLDGKGLFQQETVAILMKRTGLTYEQLFEHRVKR